MGNAVIKQLLEAYSNEQSPDKFTELVLGAYPEVLKEAQKDFGDILSAIAESPLVKKRNYDMSAIDRESLLRSVMFSVFVYSHANHDKSFSNTFVECFCEQFEIPQVLRNVGKEVEAHFFANNMPELTEEQIIEAGYITLSVLMVAPVAPITVFSGYVLAKAYYERKSA